MKHPDQEKFDRFVDYIESEQTKGHPHAALMLLYAQDAAECVEPGERWQWRHRTNKPWMDVGDRHPSWNPRLYYRRRPATIRIGDFDVSVEALREARAEVLQVLGVKP